MSDHDAILEAKLKVINETHRCVAGKTALIVIDMQHGFIDEGASLEVAAAQDIIPNISGLIDACRSKGAPVIFTEFVYADNVPCLRGDPFGLSIWLGFLFCGREDFKLPYTFLHGVAMGNWMYNNTAN
jgi:nicotinamidase-related amidase